MSVWIEERFVSADPRAANCRGHNVDASGKIVGVNLDYNPRPDTRFECVSVELINEYQAQGQTVATISVLSKDNIPLSESVILSWPWPSLNFFGYPGNSKIPAEHIITNRYFPPSKGPLAIFVGRPNDVQSDVIGGLGLPNGHHVSYFLVFKERGAVTPPVDPPPTGDLEGRVARLERIIEAMVKAA